MLEQVLCGFRQQIVVVFKDPVFIKQTVWVSLLGAVMLAIILYNIDYLQTHFPTPPRPPDRILDAVSPNRDFLTLGELFSKIQVGVMAAFFFTNERRLRRMPKLFFLLALMYILRSFAFTLTPMAQISPPEQFYPETDIVAQEFYHGMYFSGHITSALMQAFFFWNDRFKGVRFTWIVLPLALVQGVSLLVSHQHYSIDIFGGVFVAYFFMTFDFSRLIPKSLVNVPWMPWYTGEASVKK